MLLDARTSSAARPTITIAEYHRMVRTGAVAEGSHLELIDGALVEMSPHGPSHAHVISLVFEHLTRRLPARTFQVRCQVPLTFTTSEPEPDLAVVERSADDYATRHPRHAELVIEVVGSDRPTARRKIAVYAAAGIPEYWIIDASRCRIEVYRGCRRREARYAECSIFESGILRHGTIAQIAVPVARLFPRKRARRRAP